MLSSVLCVSFKRCREREKCITIERCVLYLMCFICAELVENGGGAGGVGCKRVKRVKDKRAEMLNK